MLLLLVTDVLLVFFSDLCQAASRRRSAWDANRTFARGRIFSIIHAKGLFLFMLSCLDLCGVFGKILSSTLPGSISHSNSWCWCRDAEFGISQHGGTFRILALTCITTKGLHYWTSFNTTPSDVRDVEQIPTLFLYRTSFSLDFFLRLWWKPIISRASSTIFSVCHKPRNQIPTTKPAPCHFALELSVRVFSVFPVFPFFHANSYLLYSRWFTKRKTDSNIFWQALQDCVTWGWQDDNVKNFFLIRSCFGSFFVHVTCKASWLVSSLASSVWKKANSCSSAELH